MNEETRPLLVSIWCITYNHEPYIRQCLEGFVMQKTNFRFEAIVHDDASTDGTAAIVKEYAEKYPDIIKPILETENQYSKKDGSLDRIFEKSCTGKYVAFCEGDDYWIDPLKLQKQVDYMEMHKSCTISFNKVGRVNRFGDIIKGTIPIENHFCEGEISLEMFLNEEFSNLHWAFQTSSFMFRRIIWDDEKEKRIEFFSHFHVGDMPIILWALLHGNGYYIDKIFGYYRVFSGGVTTQRLLNKEAGIHSRKSWINICHYFNFYTNYKYDNHVRKKMLFAEFELDRLEGKYWETLNYKFWWIYIKNPKTLIYTLSGIISPKFYWNLKKIRMNQNHIKIN